MVETLINATINYVAHTASQDADIQDGEEKPGAYVAIAMMGTLGLLATLYKNCKNNDMRYIKQLSHLIERSRVQIQQLTENHENNLESERLLRSKEEELNVVIREKEQKIKEMETALKELGEDPKEFTATSSAKKITNESELLPKINYPGRFFSFSSTITSSFPSISDSAAKGKQSVTSLINQLRRSNDEGEAVLEENSRIEKSVAITLEQADNVVHRHFNSQKN